MGRQVRREGPVDPVRKEREELLALLMEHPGWNVLVQGINRRRSRLIATLVMGRQLELVEIRSYQDQLALLAAFIQDPVSWVLQFDDA